MQVTLIKDIEKNLKYLLTKKSLKLILLILSMLEYDKKPEIIKKNSTANPKPIAPPKKLNLENLIPVTC